MTLKDRPRTLVPTGTSAGSLLLKSHHTLDWRMCSYSEPGGSSHLELKLVIIIIKKNKMAVCGTHKKKVGSWEGKQSRGLLDPS